MASCVDLTHTNVVRRHGGDYSLAIVRLAGAVLVHCDHRYLWRCHGYKQQYTVRFGTILEDNRVPSTGW